MLENPHNFSIMYITSIEQLTKYWKHFEAARQELNKLTPHKVEQTTFLRVAMDCISGQGAVVLYRHKGEGEILASAIVIRTYSPYNPPALLVYSVYSTQKDPHVMRFALAHGEEYARQYGIKELQAWSPRINGAAFHLFEKRWGFRRTAIYFTKAI